MKKCCCCCKEDGGYMIGICREEIALQRYVKIVVEVIKVDKVGLALCLGTFDAMIFFWCVCSKRVARFG